MNDSVDGVVATRSQEFLERRSSSWPRGGPDPQKDALPGAKAETQ